MGTRIEAATALTSQGLRKPTARRLADAAARACLAQAGKEPDDLDMLINVGIYREDNMGEPALAALIQEDIGASLGQPPIGRRGTFSFDLLNGACGVISAVQIESGLLRSGVIRLGAIVTSDVSPNLENPRATLLQPTGGAMILGWDDSFTGFTDFSIETFPEYQELFVSGLVWQEQHRHRTQHRVTGRHHMVVEAAAGYHARLADCAEEAVRRFLRRLGMGLSDVDLLVPAPCAPGFLDTLTRRLGVPGDRVAYITEDLEGSYTAGPIAALQAAIRSGRLGEARNTVLLAAGAGITVALALYRQTPPERHRRSEGGTSN
jgi:3-oxoacyl-[acyl-carrier-protein] synthase III